MRQVCALLGLLVVSTAAAQNLNYADRVVSYSPGLEAGRLTNAVAVLGPPARETADPQVGTFPVDPFSPPYLDTQVVTLGTGGSLLVRFEQPLTDDPRNPFGIDFLVFGNAFLQYNADWTTTSGLLGGTNTGMTRISVSPDGHSFFTLDPATAPSPDSWFPTDHAGADNQPVDPALTGADLAGIDLAGIRARYGGSNGGTGYDLAWARDSQGNAVRLPYVRYVRFEQLAGAADFDAVVAVQEPRLHFSDFETDPALAGWQSAGDSSLFTWNSSAKHLEVTWDSSRTNSYFYQPLGVTLNRQDDFALALDLRLTSVAVGVDPAKPFTFQIAVGLIHLESATRGEFHRGAGVDPVSGPRNLVEFAWFPDSGFGATVSPSIVSSNNQFATRFDYPIDLTTDTPFNVQIHYSAADQTLRTTLNREYMPFAPVGEVVIPVDFTDFKLDAVAICSYSDAGQDPQFGGSILAHGIIDNVLLQLPPAPVDQLLGHHRGETYEVSFNAHSGWTYTLERSTDLTHWNPVAAHTALESGPTILADPTPAASAAYYRVEARR